MTATLNHEQLRILNANVLKGSLFPALAQAILSFVFSFLLLLLIPRDMQEDDLMLFFSIASVPIIVVTVFIVARFVMPSSLFKERTSGQLVDNNQHINGHVLKWTMICGGFQLAFVVLGFVLGYMGIVLPNISLIVTFFATYLANYKIAQCMLVKGDIVLNLKS